MNERPYLTDEEVREVCDGLEQPAAMIRYLRDVVGVRVVHRKPNGMPLVGRDALNRALGGEAPGAQPRTRPNPERLRALSGGRA